MRQKEQEKEYQKEDVRNGLLFLEVDVLDRIILSDGDVWAVNPEDILPTGETAAHYVKNHPNNVKPQPPYMNKDEMRKSFSVAKIERVENEIIQTQIYQATTRWGKNLKVERGQRCKYRPCPRTSYALAARPAP